MFFFWVWVAFAFVIIGMVMISRQIESVREALGFVVFFVGTLLFGLLVGAGVYEGRPTRVGRFKEGAYTVVGLGYKKDLSFLANSRDTLLVSSYGTLCVGDVVSVEDDSVHVLSRVAPKDTTAAGRCQAK